MRQELLVLANSRKYGARCVAGLDPDGNWVRPVAARSGAGIPSSLTRVGTRSLQPLDVVSYKLIEHAPLPYQSENWVIDLDSLRFVRSAALNEEQDRLSAASLSRPEFVQDTAPTLMADAVAGMGPPLASLALLPTNNVRVVEPEPGHWRAAFFSGDDPWSLPFTDELWPNLENLTSPDMGSALVCVSLAEPYEPHGNSPRHYKLAAGIVLTP